MLIATFGPDTRLAGKRIILVNRRFVIEGNGPVSAADVMGYDRQGALVWPKEGTRTWVGSLVESQVPAPGTQPDAPLPASTRNESSARPSPGAPGRPVLSWTSSCPACRRSTLRQGETKKTFFSGLPRLVWLCPSCAAVFVQKPEAPDCYELKSAGISVAAIVQEYRKQALTTAEWQRIAQGGVSDAEIASADLQTFLTTIRDGSTVLARAAADSPVPLKRGEDFVLMCPDVVMREPRTVTQGVYGGPRIRVAKNLSFNLGGFRSAPHEELRDVDNGTFVVTTKRFVFLGSKRTVSVNLTQIIDVEPYQDAVAIHRSNKQRTEMFCNLDRYGFEFSVEGRGHTASLSGGVLACIIEGLIAAGEAATPPTRQRASSGSSRGAGPQSTADELAKLAKLRDSGILTDAEFAKLKAELIG